jgi:hypothetical protein
MTHPVIRKHAAHAVHTGAVTTAGAAAISLCRLVAGSALEFEGVIFSVIVIPALYLYYVTPIINRLFPNTDS